MSFEMEPSDEPCPDCGSTQHRSCMKILMFDGRQSYGSGPSKWRLEVRPSRNGLQQSV